MKQLLKAVYRAVVDRLPDWLAVRIMYFRYVGRWPDLNNPRTFTEKINWRKLHQHDPRFTLFADKAAVKDEIAKLVGPECIIPTLWTGTRGEDIPFDTLPLPYAIKLNHGSGNSLFIRTAADIDRKKIVPYVNAQMASAHADTFREWGYHDIQRKILVEKLIAAPEQGEFPAEYRFYCYDGKVHFVHANIHDHGTLWRSFHDTAWNRLPVGLKGFPNNPNLPPKPERLGQMIAMAEKMSAGFDFVRVDLYNVKEGILFSEMTFYPNAGYKPFDPTEWDVRFGEPWKIVPFKNGRLS